MIRRCVGAVAVATVMFLAPWAAHADEYTETRGYVTGWARLQMPSGAYGVEIGPARVYVASKHCRAPANLAPCFELPRDDATVSLTVDDDSAADVGANFEFRTAGGAVVSRGSFCGSVEGLSVPEDAHELVIFIENWLLDESRCSGLGTTGSIVATFQTPVGGTA